MSQPAAVSIPDKKSESIFFRAKAPDTALGILTVFWEMSGLQRAPFHHLLSGQGAESRVQEGTQTQYAAKGSHVEGLSGETVFLCQAVDLDVQGWRVDAQMWVLVQTGESVCKENVCLDECVVILQGCGSVLEKLA